jgi:uncharacterized protein
MSHVPHSLHAEFPEYAELISKLKSRNAHFGKLATQFDELAHQIHRAETDIEPMDDLALETLKKQRLSLKDELFRMILAA